MTCSTRSTGIPATWEIRRAARPSGNAPQAEAKDPLQQAIDDIHRAMLDYAAEMKKS